MPQNTSLSSQLGSAFGSASVNAPPASNPFQDLLNGVSGMGIEFIQQWLALWNYSTREPIATPNAVTDPVTAMLYLQGKSA